ncbi:MAG: dTMP kinase, partial [Chloroflexi bacterium]|nr:dTMP kinase [Chloroflexota bacterium]
MGLFITFEGGEGTGKTTQVALLTQRLREQGLNVVAIREPGGTPVGEEVRRWVKSETLSPETELLLFAAARAELVAQVIRPSLAAGKIVIADRYADSTMAYQGYGRGLSLDMVQSVNHAATGGLMPDVTFLLDLPVEKGLQRAEGRRDGTHETKFEQEAIAFHRR